MVTGSTLGRGSSIYLSGDLFAIKNMEGKLYQNNEPGKITLCTKRNKENTLIDENLLIWFDDLLLSSNIC